MGVNTLLDLYLYRDQDWTENHGADSVGYGIGEIVCQRDFATSGWHDRHVHRSIGAEGRRVSSRTNPL